MYIQAAIQCECGCISRAEFQDGKHAYICPKCKKEMDKRAYSKLETIMGELGDWNTDILKDAAGWGEPNMRAISVTIADLVD